MTDAGRRRGATPRPKQQPTPPPSAFERWLDRLVILAVTVALLVSVLALAIHLFYRP